MLLRQRLDQSGAVRAVPRHETEGDFLRARRPPGMLTTAVHIATLLQYHPHGQIGEAHGFCALRQHWRR